MSHEELVKLLTTGETPDGDTVGGEMAKVVANTGKLSACRPRGDRDLREIAAAGRGAEAAGEQVTAGAPSRR